MGLSVPQLLIILAIVLLLFGAKRLRSIGTDLGSAVKGFKSAIKEGDDENAAKLDAEDAPTADDIKVSNDQQNKV